jgi:hypothetical protein
MHTRRQGHGAEPGEPSDFSRIVAPLITAAMRRANRKDLARLKSLLERT